MDVISIRLGEIFNNIKIKVSIIFNYAKSEKKYLSPRRQMITARIWMGGVIRKIFLKAANVSPRRGGLFFAAVLAIAAVGLIFPSGNVYAGSIGESLGGFVLDLIAPIIYLIFYVFLYIAYAIAWIGADVINITLDPSVMSSILNISPGSSLYQAWAIFRDIANLLFILILLLVAFGTIFRSDTYNVKKSLPSLIIVAFLINFSAMITGLVIDFCNILMFGIVKMMCAGSSNSCSQDFFNALFKVAQTLFDKYSFTGVFSFDFKDAAAIAIAAIYVFVYGLVLMALGVFFIIRIAAFAILIILSPLAFFGQVAPGLKGISNKWWDNLLQYAFFGPIAVLLLYVSGLMAQNTIAVPTAIFEVNSKMSWLQQDISLIVTNIIPLIFLLAIIPITRSMGIAGANAVMNNTVGVAGKVGSFAKSYATGTTDRWLARGAQDNRKGIRGTLNRARAYLSPTVIKKAYKAHTAEQEHDYDIATGAARERMSRGVKQWKKSPIDYKRDAYEREVERTKKDIISDNPKEMANQMKEFLDRGMIAHAEGVARKLSTTGDVNETISLYKDVAGNRLYENTPEDFIKFMKDKFEPTLGEQQTAILMADIAQAEKKDGNHSFKGTSHFDETTKQWQIRPTATLANKTVLAQEAAKEFGKVEPQAKWRGLDSRTLLDQNAAGFWSLAERGEIIVNNMVEQDFTQLKKAKTEHLKRLQNVLSHMTAGQRAIIDPAKLHRLETELSAALA